MDNVAVRTRNRARPFKLAAAAVEGVMSGSGKRNAVCSGYVSGLDYQIG